MFQKDTIVELLNLLKIIFCPSSLAFPTVVCKLSLTEIKHIFKEDAIMLQISEIIRKTEEMFDLFNEYFYKGELKRPAITASPDGGCGAYG